MKNERGIMTAIGLIAISLGFATDHALAGEAGNYCSKVQSTGCTTFACQANGNLQTCPVGGVTYNFSKQDGFMYTPCDGDSQTKCANKTITTCTSTGYNANATTNCGTQACTSSSSTTGC